MFFKKSGSAITLYVKKAVVFYTEDIICELTSRLFSSSVYKNRRPGSLRADDSAGYVARVELHRMIVQEASGHPRKA